MRISKAEHIAIKSVAEAYFGVDCAVRLFGSRANDSRRGGDIDIHIAVTDDALATLNHKIEFLFRLEQSIGEREVDLVVEGPSRKNGYIDQVARQTGVRL